MSETAEPAMQQSPDAKQSFSARTALIFSGVYAACMALTLLLAMLILECRVPRAPLPAEAERTAIDAAHEPQAKVLRPLWIYVSIAVPGAALAGFFVYLVFYRGHLWPAILCVPSLVPLLLLLLPTVLLAGPLESLGVIKSFPPDKEKGFAVIASALVLLAIPFVGCFAPVDNALIDNLLVVCTLGALGASPLVAATIAPRPTHN